ncbi:uncharacterized protein LOC112344862 [Selaginella moellendorffii]|uniref:uncharacterized protein LOC112344862 n=1 Tax=Selaginella moellendorffii TaxID=88036 RepID=UPI000D1C2F6C|nr:uncharacterized protein LOC112344862 [Selaginella moellendorffii]|eukprot:XP_024526157.1 uncharacterized protein LOC112344862 [Selaginella moellendorffii]
MDPEQNLSLQRVCVDQRLVYAAAIYNDAAGVDHYGLLTETRCLLPLAAPLCRRCCRHHQETTLPSLEEPGEWDPSHLGSQPRRNPLSCHLARLIALARLRKDESSSKNLRVSITAWERCFAARYYISTGPSFWRLLVGERSSLCAVIGGLGNIFLLAVKNWYLWLIPSIIDYTVELLQLVVSRQNKSVSLARAVAFFGQPEDCCNLEGFAAKGSRVSR